MKARRALPPFASPAAALLAIVAAAVAAGGCGPEDLVLPETPNLDMLALAYEMPTAAIDPQQLDQIMADARAQLADLHLEWLPDVMVNFLALLRQRLDDNGLSDNPSIRSDTDRPRIDAVARLRRLCSGWPDMLPPSETVPPGLPANGTLEATAVVADSQLKRTLEMKGTSCRAQVEATNVIARSVLPTLDVFLNGSLDVLFYGQVPRSIQEAQVLVLISGEFGTAQMTVNGNFDFQLIYPDVTFRVPRPDGYLLATLSPNRVQLQGTNATYSCDVAILTCRQVN
jgi:hypothetical protein